MNSSQLESGRATGSTLGNIKINSAIPINKYYENKRPSAHTKNYYTHGSAQHPTTQTTHYQHYLPDAFDSQQITRTNQGQQLRSQTQKAFMKKRMQDDWRQINSMYTRQEVAQHPMSNYNQINPEDQSLSARQRIKKIVKKQMQLPKIYQDQFPIEDHRSKNSLSPMQDIQGSKTAQRFRDQNGNLVYSSRNKKHYDKINYKKAYSSQNNMDYDHKPSDYEGPQIRIIKVDQDSFDKLAKSLRKGDPIDKVLQLLEPGKHGNKKLNVNTEHPYLQKVMDKNRSTKRSKTTHHIIRPNQQQELPKDNMTYIINAHLHKEKSPVRPESQTHPYKIQDPSKQFGRDEMKGQYRTETRLEKKLKPSIRSRDIANPASFVKTDGYQKEGHYFTEDNIQEIKEERQRQRIANRVNKIQNQQDRMNSQKHIQKNLILATSSNERLPEHDKFVKMGSVEQHVKPYQR